METNESPRPLGMHEWVSLVCALKAVVVHGTYRSASLAGHGSVESLRARLVRLEEHLQRRVITRSRPAQPTAEGRRVLSDWEVPLKQLEQVWSRTVTGGSLLYTSEPLVVRCPSRFAATCIPGALASPRVAALGVSVHVELTRSAERPDPHASGAWDLAVSIRQRRPADAFEQLLGMSAQIICVASSARASEGVSQPLDLQDIDWVVDGHEPRGALMSLLGPDGSEYEVRVPRTHRASTAPERLALVRAGLGAGRFAMCELDAPLQVLGLRRLLPGYTLPPACVVASTRPGTRQAGAVEALILSLREAFAEREPQIHGAAFA